MDTQPTQDESKHPHSSFYTIARRMMLAGMGVFTLASEEMEVFIKRLVEHGELAEKDARKLFKEMLQKREEILKERRAAQAAKPAEAASKTELDALNARIAELTRQIEELKKPAANNRMPVIKRYTNRKLYDTDNNRYVTLAEVADMLRMDEDVTIVEHDSGEDITTLVILQALVDEERKSGGALTSAYLQRLLQKGRRVFRSFRDTVLLPPAMVEAEIDHRAQILVAKGLLTAEEAERIASLLKSAVEPPPPEDDVLTLQEKIAALERELQDLQGQ